ncbi:MAG: heme-binding domain-containing protein [Deltaproteobacteria bacterium]|nr:heme-binding domain-containing protein [Deltaproteobacteria bacterium]MBT4526071.1 heme-binding domain-containing protein [Deltaproteobacteria bacterium]
MKVLSIIVALIVVSTASFGHGTETHNKQETQKENSSEMNANEHMSNMDNDLSQIHLDQTNQAYQKYVKVIFEKKCFDCHGSVTTFPWYYKIPGVKQLMDRDIREAKEHLDMSNDFPFGGHGEPAADLKSIKKSIEDDTMPLFMYRLTHPDSKLTEAEQKIVFNWIDESIKKLEANK